MALGKNSAAGKILHNSFWYGLETLLETIVFLGTSIAVARYLGPEKLGYFTYINFFIVTITRASGSGISSATRKYMSEYLAADRPGMARAVYHLAFRYQLIGALAFTAFGLAGIALFGEPGYRIMASILIVSIIPGLLSWIPAAANSSYEDVAPNTISAFGYLVVYAVIIVLTLTLHWGLIGIASAQLLGRCIEVALRTHKLARRLHTIPLDTLEPALIQRIRKFCIEALGIQLLMSVVWDRSEMVFLRHFASLTQIGFYSVSFGLTNNLLVVPRTFSAATGLTLMVESGRDPARVDSIVKSACRYLLLVVFPVHLGAAAVTALAIRFVYGERYVGAIPVLIIASILAMPRAFQEIPETLLRAADRQKRMLALLGITAAVNIALDWALIRHHGAVGAAIANGCAQTFGILLLWLETRRTYTFHFPFQQAFRLFAAGLLMASVAYAIAHALPTLPGLIAAILTAVPVYFVLVKLFHGLDSSDRVRLAPIGNRLPGFLRVAYQGTIAFVTPAAAP